MFQAAKALIDAGVDVNKAGDRCYTPLHVACMQGDAQMVKLLVDQGADLFALSEGDAPFAKLGKNPWKDDCKSENIKLYIQIKGENLPICQQCWSKIADQEQEW